MSIDSLSTETINVLRWLERRYHRPKPGTHVTGLKNYWLERNLPSHRKRRRQVTKELIEAGILERVGDSRNGAWFIYKPNG